MTLLHLKMVSEPDATGSHWQVKEVSLSDAIKVLLTDYDGMISDRQGRGFINGARIFFK